MCPLCIATSKGVHVVANDVTSQNGGSAADQCFIQTPGLGGGGHLTLLEGKVHGSMQKNCPCRNLGWILRAFWVWGVGNLLFKRPG